MSDALTFEADKSGERVDTFLARSCEDLSRSRLQGLITQGHVTVDGRPARPSTRLRQGQTVGLVMPEPAPSRLVPWSIPLDIVYEDGEMLVVDKPAGLTAHPAPGHRDDTLANAVLAHCPDLEGIGGAMRPGIVHRLDRDTSGLVVVAKNERSHAALSAQFKERRVTKVYQALVHGALQPSEAVVEAPIGRHPRDRKRMAVVASGRDARTEYRVVANFRGYTHAEVRPTTGRTHQVRVHMASIGHPLAGDATYGRPHPMLRRHFLHASMLGFEHPSSGEPIELKSELPPELRAFLESLSPQSPTPSTF